MTLPLFSDTWRLMEGPVISELSKDSSEQESNDLHNIFGEMEITARLMITGGPAVLGADITMVDLATFPREGHEVELASSYISLIIQSTTSVV